jgi:Ca2+-binding EF-hand superfamily protein
MRGRHLLALASLLAAGALLAAPRPADQARAAAPAAPATAGADAREVQDVVFFAEARPVLVRLRIRVDGKPFRAAWEAYMDALFRHLDADGDGYLNKEEVARAPAPQRASNAAQLGPRRAVREVALGMGGVWSSSGAPSLESMDTNRDGKVSRAEFADYYRRNGAAPFQLNPGRQRGRLDGQVRLFLANGRMLGGRQPSAEALNKRLFELLDTNKDGKLSRAELARGPEVLSKLDADDDEMLTVPELMGNAPSGDDDVVLALAFGDGRLTTGSPDDGPFHAVTADRGDAALAKRLLERYGGKGARKLSAKELGLDKETFDRLDADGDGALDAEELARFARRPPDLELAVRLGKRGPGEALVELLPSKGRPAPLGRHLSKGKGGAPVLDLNNTTVEFSAPPRASTSGDLAGARQRYTEAFKAADKDGNGYLDEAEAQRSPLFRGRFKAMDRDGDGMLYLKEVLAYVDKTHRLSTGALTSVVTLNASEQGLGLFDLLDADKDGRLSVRELRQLPKLIDKLDRDGDGRLSRRELPRSYRATFQLGPNNLSADYQLYQVALIRGRLAARVDGTPPRPQRAEGPLWFRKMDHNRDGDVSRREFLGSDEQFRRIDTDGDGLISLEEALAFDKKMRAAQDKGR